MELKYTKTSLVQEVGGYVHMVDGVEKVDDLIVTYYRPTNFEGTVKNFVLGDNHELWDQLHDGFETKILQEWMEELGYSISDYYVCNLSKTIKRRQDIGNIQAAEYPITNAEEI
jgi:hypothetical protein